MPVPNVGWFISGYTANPAISLDVDRVGWNADLDQVECRLVDGHVDLDDRTARSYIEQSYGPEWAVSEVFLTTEGVPGNGTGEHQLAKPTANHKLTNDEAIIR